MTQHELDRQKLVHERRHFDKMSSWQVITALVWRERTFLLLVSNVGWVVYYITHTF